jgi:two-component system sensor histidine kinase DegS
VIRSIRKPWSNAGRSDLRQRLVAARGLASKRLRDPVFWQIQFGVAVITISHYVADTVIDSPEEMYLHWIPVLFYVFPIIYASLRFGMEGGLWTGLLCALISLPSMIIEHRHALNWLTEATPISTSVVVGIILSTLVEHEAEARKRAEEMAARVALLNRRLTNAQEEEWRRLARELHDETAQSLILLCQSADRVAAAARLPRTAREDLGSLRLMAQDILAGVRRFSRDLRPSVLDDLGLVAAIEWLAGQLSENQGIHTRVEVLSPMPRLSSEVELGLFRIVQEALRNVSKHAQASEVVVTIRRRDGVLQVGVEDDGRGFVVPKGLDDLVVHGHLGLIGMQERAQLLGGNVRLESAPEKGTRLTVTIHSRHDGSASQGTAN